MTKIKIFMKTPDAVDRAVEETFPYVEENDDSEVDSELIDLQREEAKAILKNWFEFGETVTIEVDLQKKTAIVVKQR